MKVRRSTSLMATTRCAETVYARRASAILYHLALSQSHSGVYLLPANVCPVVPLTLLKAGRRFEFIDISPRTLCMDEACLRARVAASHRPAIAGIVYVRTYGFVADVAGLFRDLKAAAPQAYVIDDRCAARPEPDLGMIDEDGADVLLYSTGYAKQVDLNVGGGFAHMRSGIPYRVHETPFVPEDLDGLTRLYKRHIGTTTPLYQNEWPDDTHPIRRYARWLDTRPPAITGAAYHRSILSEREQSDARKAEYNALYRTLIPAHVQLPSGYHRWRFTIRVRGKTALLRRLRQAGLLASDHYFSAARLFGGTRCFVTESLHHEVINLFSGFRTTAAQVQEVAKMVRDHVYQVQRHSTV